MLVDAHEITPGAPRPAEASAPCPPTPGTFPTAYELTGPREEEVGPFLGRRVEVTGIQKEADAEPVGTSGILRPTGGFDPLGHELHLFEVELAAVREVTALAAAPLAAPEPEAPEVAEAEPVAPELEVAAEPAAPEAEIAAEPAPEPQVAEEAPRVAEAQLPPTASPLPLAGLIGLLSLGVAAGIRAVRRRR